MANLTQRAFNIAVSIDQTVYVLITLGNGSPDESLSAAAYRTEQKGRILGKIFRPVIDCIFSPFETEHCRKAYESELNKKQLPIEYQ